MRLTGAIPKQSNSKAQIRPSPWLNLRRKPELDLLPLELDFLYGSDRLGVGGVGAIQNVRVEGQREQKKGGRSLS